MIEKSPHRYGRSILGAPLEVWESEGGSSDVLLVAGLHGDEADTTRILSRAIRATDRAPKRASVVLCANPDGMIRGTRGNARGVDLNRNFPASSWDDGVARHRWLRDQEQVVELSTGASPLSEPETRALVDLIEVVAPSAVVALHSPLGCIDDPLESEVGSWIATRSGLPRVSDVGYKTPGSLGDWAREENVVLVTYELPPHLDGESIEHHTHICRLLMTGEWCAVDRDP